jgi:two-component system chemotaxis sensor kinase CheA
VDPTVDSFWEEFQHEADEHVATADRLLDHAMSGALGREDVAELFRAFHSVKGLARVMGLEGLEIVAHWAESLLGLVRDGGADLDAELLQGLSLAVGQLGQMMTGIVRDRADVSAPDDLVARLHLLHSARGGAAADTAVAIAPEAGDGGDSMIALLAELMSEFLPGIAALAVPVLDAASASGPGDAVTALGNAADVMEMPELTEILSGLGRFSTGADEETAGARLALLVRLGQQAALIGEIAGADAGADRFAAKLAESAGASIRAGLAMLTPSGAGEAASLLEAIGHARAARLVALAGEAARPRGDGPLAPRLMRAIETALGAVMGPWGSGGAMPPDLDDLQAAPLAEEIRAALALPGHATGLAGVAGLHIPEEFLPVLSQENRRDLERAAGDGQLIYQLLADLDAADLDEAEAGGFLERLAEIGRSVTSRTVPQSDRNWFEMLVVSPLSPAEMQESLAGLDPDRRWVKMIRLAGEASSVDEGPAAEAVPRTEAGRGPGAVDASTTGDALVLRVRSAALDRLMAAVGDVRVAAAALSQTLGQNRRKAEALAGLTRLRDRLPAAAAAELGRHLDALREREGDLADLDRRLSTSVSQLHADALDLRVVPVETVLARLPRIARDLAQRQNKLVHIRIEGREVRIDKSVVQQLLDPLMHMMRNAVDHGIEAPEIRRAAGKPETATITLRALQRASEFHLEVIDDGCGLNAEAIRAKAVARGLVGEAESRTLSPDRVHRFIFEPGFSTAAAVTETSGRGVGMDVVLHTLGRLGGRIDIRTEPGAGTTFVLILPLSAAVLPALLVEIQGQCLAIPERSIATVEEIGSDRVRQAGGRRVLLRGNLALPLHPLAALLGMAASGREGHAVVVTSGPASIALAVDRLLRRQELLLRDLHPALAALPGVGGAALLGDGSPVLVLDAEALIALARNGRRVRSRWPREPASAGAGRPIPGADRGRIGTGSRIRGGCAALLARPDPALCRRVCASGP